MGMVEDVGTLLLREQLQVGGVSVTAANLFYGQRPDQPDDCLALYETVGSPPEYDHGSPSPQWERPRLQVVGRSADPVLARDLTAAVYRVIAAIPTNTWLTDGASSTRTRYRRITAVSSPFQMGLDENRRYLWSASFQVEKRPGPE